MSLFSGHITVSSCANARKWIRFLADSCSPIGGYAAVGGKDR